MYKHTHKLSYHSVYDINKYINFRLENDFYARENSATVFFFCNLFSRAKRCLFKNLYICSAPRADIAIFTATRFFLLFFVAGW